MISPPPIAIAVTQLQFVNHSLCTIGIIQYFEATVDGSLEQKSKTLCNSTLLLIILALFSQRIGMWVEE